MQSKFLPFCVFFCVFLFQLLQACPAGAGDAPKVLGVDFYPSGAKFLFQTGQPGPDGRFELSLSGAFDPSSVRFPKREEALFVKVEQVLREEWTPPALQSLKREIDRKGRDLKLLESHQNAIQQTLERVNGPLPKDFSGKDLILYIGDSREMLARLGEELVDLNLTMEKAGKELNALQAEYQRRMPGNAGSVIQIQGASATKQPLLFEAFTPHAGWAVFYDMNLDSATGLIDAKMRARAWQKTGLDTVGEFTFHTRQPFFSIVPPEVRPLTVNLRSSTPPSPHPAYSKAKAEVLYEAADDTFAAPTPRTQPQMVSTMADISVKGKGDLTGDGKPGDVELGRFEMKSAPVLVAVPEQNPQAWIVASMDTLVETLLPGTAELAVDGEKTGVSRVNEHDEEPLRLPFGMASRITAKKIPLVGKTGSSWLGKGILEDGYTLEITNGMRTECKITVKDRVPVSVNDKISLEITKIDPTPTDRDRDNRIAWELTIRPGETKKIVVEYKLFYPGDEKLEYR
ncbi:MAG: DUF4139 domain-containing protein [Synergistaceae bacterium]|nr:DUF4139 domain-containing protein [Synergistaceae bacterium]